MKTISHREMSRLRNPKQPDHKYFDIKMITELDATSESYKEFIKAYASYVIARHKSFSSKYVFEFFSTFLLL